MILRTCNLMMFVCLIIQFYKNPWKNQITDLIEREKSRKAIQNDKTGLETRWIIWWAITLISLTEGWGCIGVNYLSQRGLLVVLI